MKPKLLLVEPVEELREVLKLMFSAKFDVIDVRNTAQAIASIDSNIVQIVIANFHQPDTPAISIAKHIEKMEGLDKPALILLGEGIEDAKIEDAFKAGIADYVEKPFNVVAFHNRIIRFSEDLDHVKKLHDSDKRKHNLAETAMKQSGAYGSGLDLIARLNQVNTVDDFLIQVVKAFSAMNYHCAVEFRFKDQQFSLDSDCGACHENEQRVFRLLHDKGRLYAFGRRIIFNDKHSSILVKNMPLVGTSSYDAAIDLFAKLIPALDARFISLMNQMTMNQSSDTLKQSIGLIKQHLSQMETERKDQQHDIANSISLSFHQLEMTEIQESFFLNLIENHLDNTKSNEKFSTIIALLTDCADKLEVEQQTDDTTQDSDEDDDMELF